MEGEWGKDFDFEILWCVSEDGLNIDRGYMIPKDRIYNLDIKKGKRVSQYIKIRQDYIELQTKSLLRKLMKYGKR